MKPLLPFLFCFLTLFLQGQQADSTSLDFMLETPGAQLSGTLLLPDSAYAGPVVLIIAGSGPTDRNGNNPSAKNNSLLLLADSLRLAGIASLRYDKRGIGASMAFNNQEDSLRFEHLAADAAAWIHWLRDRGQFSRIFVAGHSEGSLLGMLAVQQAGADGFISLAGAGRPAGKVLREQLQKQPPYIKAQAFPMLDSLEAGVRVDSVPKVLMGLLRPSVQPYMMSWFKYDPAKEIVQLQCPVLIVQGTTDIQVSVDEAKLLAAARPEDRLVLIEQMNHVFKVSDLGFISNMMTYSKPELPLAPGLVEAVVEFIKMN